MTYDEFVASPIGQKIVETMARTGYATWFKGAIAWDVQAEEMRSLYLEESAAELRAALPLLHDHLPFAFDDEGEEHEVEDEVAGYSRDDLLFGGNWS